MVTYKLKIIVCYNNENDIPSTLPTKIGNRVGEMIDYLNDYNIVIDTVDSVLAQVNAPINDKQFKNLYENKITDDVMCEVLDNYSEVDDFNSDSAGYNIVMYILCGVSYFGGGAVASAFVNKSAMFIPSMIVMTDEHTVSDGSWYSWQVMVHEFLHTIGCVHPCDDSCDNLDIMDASVSLEDVKIKTACQNIITNSPKSNSTFNCISPVCSPITKKCVNGDLHSCKSDGSGWDISNDHSSCKYKGCSGNTCITKNHSGALNPPNQCSSNSDCGTQTHKECAGGNCVTVSGAGVNQCNSNSDCITCNNYHHQGCLNGNEVWWFDSCNNPHEKVSTCMGGTCVNGACEFPQVCIPNAEKCVSGDLQKCQGDGSGWFTSQSNSSHCRYDECDGCDCSATEYSGTPDSKNDECNNDGDCCGDDPCDNSWDIMICYPWKSIPDHNGATELANRINNSCTDVFVSVWSTSSSEHILDLADNQNPDAIFVVGGQGAWENDGIGNDEYDDNAWEIFFSNVTSNDSSWFQRTTDNGFRIFGVAGMTADDTMDMCECIGDYVADELDDGVDPYDISDTNSCP